MSERETVVELCGGGVAEGGIDTELAYPYHAVDGTCSWSNKAVATRVKSVVNITQYDEDELKVRDLSAASPPYLHRASRVETLVNAERSGSKKRLGSKRGREARTLFKPIKRNGSSVCGSCFRASRSRFSTTRPLNATTHKLNPRFFQVQ